MSEADLVRIAEARQEALRAEIRRIEKLIDTALALIEQAGKDTRISDGGAQIIPFRLRSPD